MVVSEHLKISWQYIPSLIVIFSSLKNKSLWYTFGKTDIPFRSSVSLLHRMGYMFIRRLTRNDTNYANTLIMFCCLSLRLMWLVVIWTFSSLNLPKKEPLAFSSPCAAVVMPVEIHFGQFLLHHFQAVVDMLLPEYTPDTSADSCRLVCTQNS